MSKLRRGTPVLWLAAALCLALPASASGAVTIGSNLAGIATKAPASAQSAQMRGSSGGTCHYT